MNSPTRPIPSIPQSFVVRVFATAFVLLFAVLGMFSTSASAQTWPTKPVRLIVPFPAGAAPDVVARLVAERLGTLWGQSVFVENRPGAGTPFLKSGGLKAIAVSSSARVAGFENVPTISETLPGFEINGWFILAAPSGTPNDVVRRMNAEMNKVLVDPVVIARMRDFGIVADTAGTPENAAKFVQAEKELWTRLTRSIGIEPE